MAISFVSETDFANNAASPGPTISHTSAGGNWLIVAGLVFTSTTSISGITSISDSAGNTWHFATGNSQSPPSQAGSGGGDFYCVFVGWTSQDVGAVTSVTIHDGTGNSDFWRVALMEFSGIVQADSGAATFQAAAANPTATVGVTNSGDLVIGVADSRQGNITALPAGWTALPGGQVFIGDDFPGAAGPLSPAWTMASSDYAVALMSFSPVALTNNVTASFGLAMAPLGESFTAAERMSASFGLAMAPLKSHFTATETGSNISASFGLAMAPLKMSFSQHRAGSAGVPSSEEARGFKRWLFWEV